MSYVLVVEDNEDLRALYRQAMKLDGYKVVMAANGQEALEILNNGQVIPKLILLDLMMPVMDGWQFLEKKNQTPEFAQIPVVVCSAAKESIPENVPFMRKPVDLDQLSEVAAQYCAI